MKQLIYIPVYIKGKEENLPKEDGIYYVGIKNILKSTGLKSMIFTTISKNKWLNEVNFWLKSVELPDEEAMEAELAKLQCDDVLSEKGNGTRHEYYFTEKQKDAFRKCFDWFESNLK